MVQCLSGIEKIDENICLCLWPHIGEADSIPSARFEVWAPAAAKSAPHQVHGAAAWRRHPPAVVGGGGGGGVK
jgi:hypothetical protein